MKEIDKVFIALADRWREVTFAGILRIPFPVEVPARENTAESHRDRTAALLQSIRNRMHADSAPSSL